METKGSPSRAAKGATRFLVLLLTIISLRPAARILPSHCSTSASSCWLPWAVRVSSTSSTSASTPFSFKKAGVMALTLEKRYSGVMSMGMRPPS